MVLEGGYLLDLAVDQLDVHATASWADSAHAGHRFLLAFAKFYTHGTTPLIEVGEWAVDEVDYRGGRFACQARSEHAASHTRKREKGDGFILYCVLYLYVL
jgi:hypothetical protein